jgi:two-component system, LytTR family, response regulator
MDNNLTCVIIDDEPLAQQLIEKFIKRIPTLSLISIFDNAIEALEKIDSINPDIVFLDINMPEMSGFEFIRTFRKIRPNVIMTTAYPQFAMEGYEHDVVDYLLKPIPFDRFVRAISKVKDKLQPVFQDNIASEKIVEQVIQKEEGDDEKNEDDLIDAGMIDENFLWVKEDRKLVKVDFDEIVYVEGMKDYIKKFLRINRSFIINTKFMVALDGNMVELENGKKLSIGSNYKDIIKNAMKAQLR